MIAKSNEEIAQWHTAIDQAALRMARGNKALADELAQEGKLSLWLAMQDYIPGRGTDPDQFLRVRVKQRMVDELRREMRHGWEGSADIDLEIVYGVGATPEDLVAAAEVRDQVEQAEAAEMAETLQLLAQLPDRDRDYLRQRLAGASFRGLAAHFGVSFTRAKTVVKRALRRLEELRAPAELEEEHTEEVSIVVSVDVVVHRSRAEQRAGL